MTNNKKLLSLARVYNILDVAKNMAKKQDKEHNTYQVSNHIEDMRVHTEYAEPGYEAEHGVIIIGNWNDITTWDNKSNSRKTISNLPSRLANIFEKMGADIEWCDEWSACSHCDKLFRTSGDSYSWQPSYVLGDGEVSCIECVEKDAEEYLKSLEGNPRVCNTIESINPTDHGYVCVQDRLETGWHPGQDADPKKIAKELEEKGISRFLFNLDENSQFYSTWSVYIHSEEMALFEKTEREKMSLDSKIERIASLMELDYDDE